jgi:hypothetical protein
MKRVSSLISSAEEIGDYRLVVGYKVVTNALVICDNTGVSRSDPVQLRERFEVALDGVAAALERRRAPIQRLAGHPDIQGGAEPLRGAGGGNGRDGEPAQRSTGGSPVII